MKLVVNNGTKIGRNDPCSCGSGRKYKKCCADKGPEPEPSNLPPMDPATARMEMEAMMGQMSKIIREKGLSIEEANSYFTGRHMTDPSCRTRKSLHREILGWKIKITPKHSGLLFPRQQGGGNVLRRKCLHVLDEY